MKKYKKNMIGTINFKNAKYVLCILYFIISEKSVF